MVHLRSWQQPVACAWATGKQSSQSVTQFCWRMLGRGCIIYVHRFPARPGGSTVCVVALLPHAHTHTHKPPAPPNTPPPTRSWSRPTSLAAARARSPPQLLRPWALAAPLPSWRTGRGRGTARPRWVATPTGWRASASHTSGGWEGGGTLVSTCSPSSSLPAVPPPASAPPRRAI